MSEKSIKKGGQKRKRRAKSNRQKVWEYIRRNRTFRIGDILMVVGVSESSLQLLVRQLLKAEYLKPVERKQAFKDKRFKLVINSGVICPSVSIETSILWDKNINKKLYIGVSDAKKKTICCET